ncbi:Predicted kinase, aminoglycoside phosphotransferase (APT) family [Albimonas donghaensis]|uniref:Predicted kinase, aminoglycoside phosphotransferase (APT) family n=1 Tax=Albimonas donghaensis TaxID=356660 RepID=A0A1H2QGI7_9RHOB|nr:phosphotransferase family protein [Albimonas donghaensis]SDW06347.1 Predicted kinase, aminoglycoside phosphotransferase (APT) family [Albimonas donghaensis]
MTHAVAQVGKVSGGEVAGVDLARLAGWMDLQGLGEGRIEDARPLAGGTQNVLIRFRRSGRDYVLRRPPPVPRENSNRTMEREARVLAALAEAPVPHPRLIAACADPAPLGVAFYLMEPVEGFNAVAGLPALHRGDPAIRRRMGFALVEGAAALHAVDPVAAGLSDFGRPEGYLERQADRWLAQLDDYARHAAWPGRAGLPGVDRVADWLRANLPPASAPGILHGDYQFANVMYRPDSGELAAIVDWELATLGDPLVDLGWIVACYPGSGGPELPVLKVEPWDGFPTADELVARYGEISPRPLDHIRWYVALACFRLAIILEGTYARACEGRAPKATGDLLHATAVALLGRALHRIGG